MNKIKKINKSISNFLFDHYYVKETLYSLKQVFLAVLAAFIFSLGFTCFINPHSSNFTIATGGVSGLSQIVAIIFKLSGHELSHNIIESIGYTFFNAPLLIFAFLKIGKKFSIYTTINVVATSIFVFVFSIDGGLGDKVSQAFVSSIDGTGKILLVDSLIVRVLFGALCTGISSALTFSADFSSGGIDIVTYYIGMIKSSQLGKYGIVFNAFIVGTFSFLRVFESNPYLWANFFISLLYSVCYLAVVALVVDMINLRNKKVQIQIITKSEKMGDILISNFPHGATLSHGTGVYSKGDCYIFFMVASSNEYSKIVALAKRIDKHAFISVTSLVQVYGNFFSKPIE